MNNQPTTGSALAALTNLTSLPGIGRATNIFFEPDTGTSTVAPTVARPPVASTVDDDEGDDGDEIIVGNKARTVSKYEQRLRAENASKRATIKANDARHTAELADLKAQIAAAATLAKSNTEAAVAAAMKGVNDRVTQTELKAALTAAGVVNAEAGLKLIDASGISVDEAGAVKGIAEAVTKLKTDSAFLFTTPPTSSATSTPAPKPAETVAKQAKDMTEAEFQAGLNALTGAATLTRR